MGSGNGTGRSGRLSLGAIMFYPGTDQERKHDKRDDALFTRRQNEPIHGRGRTCCERKWNLIFSS